MNAMWNNLVELSKGFLGGVVVGLIAPWVIHTFGTQIWTSIKSVINSWTKPTASAPIAPTVAVVP